MAVSVRASNAIQGVSGGPPATAVVNKPTGTVDGDLLLAFVTAASAGTVSTPSGWTLERTITNGSRNAYLFSKVALSEGSSYGFTTPDQNIISAGVTTIAGPAIVSAVYATNGQANSSSTTCTTPGVTPLANSLIGLFVANYNLGTVSGYTIATSSPTFTEEYDFATNATGIAAAFGVRAAATATGNGTSTFTIAATNIGMIAAISPGLDVTTATAPLYELNAFFHAPIMVNLLSMTVNIQSVVFNIWGNATKSISSWINQSKS